jgi:4-alpha-glucanotransferase
MNFPRAAGILLHPTSLPSRFGIGDLGAEAFQFVDFLVKSKQTYWQVLPLGQTGYGDSPYQCFSAFAGNIYLISPAELMKDGFLSEDDLAGAPEFAEGKVDFGKMIDFKLPLLKKAFENFRRSDNGEITDSFRLFCQFNAFWLEDYALFRAVKLAQDQKSWQEWDEGLKLRRPEAL